MKLSSFISASVLVSCIVWTTSCSQGNEHPGKHRGPNDTVEARMTQPVAADSTTSKISYDSYCNQAYHYCIDYPQNLLIPQGESGSGDGQAFQSIDGKSKLLVYRDFRDNMDPDHPFELKTAYTEDTSPKAGYAFSYKKLGHDFYVISGHHNANVFYQKTILSDGQLATAILEYSEQDKALYDAVCAKLYASFH